MRRVLPRRVIALLKMFMFASFGAGCDFSVRTPADNDSEGLGSSIPRFTDVLPQSRITFHHHFLDWETGASYRVSPYDHGSGVCVADFNGDGWDDVYFLNFLGANQLYLNQGGLTFLDATETSGIGLGQAVCVGAAAGDYDNDGDADLYVTTYRGGNHLFRNRGNATFDDVTESAGVGYVGHSSGTTWFDYDLDGDLDLYLVNIGRFTTDTLARNEICAYEAVQVPFGDFMAQPDELNPGEPNILWRNDGGGRFTDVTRHARLTAAEWNAGMAVADIDLDGDLDVYVSSMFGPNHLFINQGDETFREDTDRALRRTSWGGMGCAFFEANGDAFPDLFVADMHSDMWSKPDDDVSHITPHLKYDSASGPSGDGRAIASAAQTRAARVLFGNTFFLNRGNGRFTEWSTEANVETWWPWGVAPGDFNNDGATDLFLPSGMGFPYPFWPNALLLNDGHARFHDVTQASGLAVPREGEYIAEATIDSYVMENRRYPGARFSRSSRSAATADFDHDGDLDLVVNNFNHEPYLLRNDTPRAHFLQVRLQGTTANADGFGARVVVHAGGHSWSRHSTSAQGYLSQSSAVVHFGLGHRSHVDRVEVFWPGWITPQIVVAPPIDRRLHVQQPRTSRRPSHDAR